MIVVSGPSGYGKSVAAAWARARHRAYYLQLDDFITKKSLLVNLCKVLGLEPKGATWELIDIVAAQLHQARRPLIIDEFDFIVDKAMVMSVFSLYEKSRASIILVGEEAMPAKLAKWEKFDGRVLDTLYAEAVGLDDARILARHKYPDFPLADDLLAHLVKIASGSVRRVNNNLGLTTSASSTAPACPKAGTAATSLAGATARCSRPASSGGSADEPATRSDRACRRQKPAAAGVGGDPAL